MTSKEFLREVRKEQKEIIMLEKRIKETGSAYSPPAIRYDLDRVQTTPKDPYDEYLEKLSKYQDRLRKTKKRLMENAGRAYEMIDSLENSDERKALMEYYLSPDLPTWDDVANRLNFSRQRVLQLHGNAIRKLEKT